MKEYNVKEHWFVVKCLGSKKYPTVKVYYDKSTQWTGLPRKNDAAPVGDPVRVEAVMAKDGSFKAASIKVQDPHEKPASLGKPSPKP